MRDLAASYRPTAVAVCGNDIIKLQRRHAVNLCNVRLNREICFFFRGSNIRFAEHAADVLVGLIICGERERINQRCHRCQ